MIHTMQRKRFNITNVTDHLVRTQRWKEGSNHFHSTNMQAPSFETIQSTRSKLRNHPNKCGISKSSRYHATHCIHENACPFQTCCFAFVRSRGNTHTLAERLIKRPNSNLGDVNVDVGQSAPHSATIPVVRMRPYDERNANVPV